MCHNTDKNDKIPALCAFWRNLYLSLPVIRIFGLDVQLTLLSMVVLTTIRYAAEYTQIYLFGWPMNHMTTKIASASVSAIFHSLNLIPTLVLLLIHQPYVPSEHMSRAPKWWQDTTTAMLQFCTGYMIYDGLINILYLKYEQGLEASDYMFLGHHFATSFYMTTARIYQSGHISAMMCMLVGECTNPLHNSFYFAEAALTLDCCNGPRMQDFFNLIVVLFSSTYVVMRAIVGPLACLHMTSDLWRKRTLPIWLLTIWSIMIWGVIFGSIPWIKDCWNMLRGAKSEAPNTMQEL